MEKLSEEKLVIGLALIGRLEELLRKLDHDREDLSDTIEYMEIIKHKMIESFARTRQMEIMEHIAKMEEIINYTKDLQNKKDATAM